MDYALRDDINLLVPGRIDARDAERQQRTAAEILRRLNGQPGIVLADEVGMGKTFVALSVAVSVALSDARRRPVVVMVPAALREKWPKDFEVFRNRCLPPKVNKVLRAGSAARPVEFLKLLDDPARRRCHLIFVTHGTMSSALYDKWVMLALIGRAIRGRWHVDDLRERLSWQLPSLLSMRSHPGMNENLCYELLRTPPHDWLGVMQRHGVDPAGYGRPEEADDPVPAAIIDALDRLDLEPLWDAIRDVPARVSKNYDERLANVRDNLRRALKDEVWPAVIRNMRLRLSLLILDEAHHLKNAQTQLASLFHLPESREDAASLSQGALAGTFERMLFLTATPFQLGHAELCSVLDRFDGIAWSGNSAPQPGRAAFKEARETLRRSLDAAQLAAMRLDYLWGRLAADDLRVGETHYADVELWWKDARGTQALTPHAQLVIDAYDITAKHMQEANALLRPWVIRHLRGRTMTSGTGEAVARRQRLPGRAIAHGDGVTGGLSVQGDAVLPFLLAARATMCAPDRRPLYAEGLASSFETFLDTRKSRTTSALVLDTDDTMPEAFEVAEASDQSEWYLGNLEELVQAGVRDRRLAHPKLDATVERTIALWESGEKVLIFCYYVVTGRILRERISRALSERLTTLAASRLGCIPADAPEQLERLAKRFFDTDSPLRRACDLMTTRLVKRHKGLSADLPRLLGIVRRFVRTPSFLTRYLLNENRTLDKDGFERAVEMPDASGMSLTALLDRFFTFLSDRPEECTRYLDALDGVQTGGHQGQDVDATLTDDERQGADRDTLLPNVRLVNGAVRAETRQRLMYTFNTPFYPEILIASAVMAEGVDLHLNCRHVIHHDLCWNPSTLEQRTGRVDRIGAKCEQARKPVRIYLPYLAETQDEKMYRVVMDRERWFSVVMGEKFEQNARSAEKLAARVPLPEGAARALAFQLGAEIQPLKSVELTNVDGPRC